LSGMNWKSIRHNTIREYGVPARDRRWTMEHIWANG
jgi:hypothetical protein